MENERNSVTDKIFEILRVKNISQKKLAEMTGISTSAISDWKHKGTTPSAVKIQKICKALEVAPEEIIGKEKDKFEEQYIIGKDNELYEFIKEYEGMEEGARKRILAYALAMMNSGV